MTDCAKPADSQNNQKYQVLTDEEILSSRFSRPEPIVPGLIYPGLTIIAGKPKIGKSLLSTDIGIAIASGGRALGSLDVDAHEVLYLALEDTPWRLQDRLSRMFNGYSPTKRIHFATAWPRFDSGFIKEAEIFLRKRADTKVIIVDTFTKVRSLNRQGGTPYERDYIEASALKSFADDNKLSIILIHHLRKAEARDVMDMVSGSVGLTGAADTILIMQRERGNGNATLFTTGRDIEEIKIGLKLNPDTLTWSIAGTAVEERISLEQKEILEILQAAKRPLRLIDIAESAKKKRPVVHKHLASLIEQNLIIQPGYGQYEFKGESGETAETSETAIH